METAPDAPPKAVAREFARVGRSVPEVCQQALASDRSAGASVQTWWTQRSWCPLAQFVRRGVGATILDEYAGHPTWKFLGESSRNPYLLPSSGALTASTIDLVSRPAAAAAAATIAERSRRCLLLMATSPDGGMPDPYSGGSIGSTARQGTGLSAVLQSFFSRFLS